MVKAQMVARANLNFRSAKLRIFSLDTTLKATDSDLRLQWLAKLRVNRVNESVPSWTQALHRLKKDVAIQRRELHSRASTL